MCSSWILYSTLPSSALPTYDIHSQPMNPWWLHHFPNPEAQETRLKPGAIVSCLVPGRSENFSIIVPEDGKNPPLIANSGVPNTRKSVLVNQTLQTRQSHGSLIKIFWKVWGREGEPRHCLNHCPCMRFYWPSPRGCDVA